MAKNIRWMIPFKTLNDKNAVINIYKEGYFDEVTMLEPAYNTFETQESTDEELMKPIRTHTGYIRIIDNGDIGGLMPSDNRQHYVEFLIEGDLKWCGYMQADTFSEDWDITPLEVEFPVISGIGILDSISMDQDLEMDLTSLCGLLLECIDATGVDYNYIYIPKEIKESAASEFYLLPLDLRISRFNFFKVNNSVNTDDPDWERYDADTYSDLLEELCKFWGWTLHERGRDLYLVSTRDVDYMKVSIRELRQKLSNLPSVSYESVSIPSMAVSDMELAGNSHKKDILQGRSRISVLAKVNYVGDVVPVIDKENLKVEAFFRRTYRDFAGARAFYEQVVLYNRKDEYGIIEMKNYNGEWVDISEQVSGEERYNSVGATFLEYDRFETLSNKRNYDYVEAIRIYIKANNKIGIQPSENIANRTPVLTMKGSKEAMYNSGAFVIGGVTNGIEQSYYIDLNKLVNTKQTNGKCMLPIVFRVGGDYWNGNNWVNEWSKFEIRVGAQDDEMTTEGTGKIVSTKTLDMPYNGADGYVIPINKALSGEVEIQILFPYTATTTDILYIDGLKVEYYKEDDNVGVSERKNTDENKYSSNVGRGYDKEMTVELAMATNNDNPAAYSILFNSPWVASGSSVEKLYFVGEGMKRPEEYLLSNLKQVYGRITEKLTLQMEREDSVTPLMRLTRSGKRYALLSENVNWSDGTVEYIIEDLP